MRSGLDSDIICMTLKYLNDENYKESLHTLERESGAFFDMNYFKEQVQNGEWDEAERYLRGFTSMWANTYSTSIFFQIRMHKFLEALDGGDRAKAADVLKNELKEFASDQEELLYKLLTSYNIREYVTYTEEETERNRLVLKLQNFIEQNPVFDHKKLIFPDTANSSLRDLYSQRVFSDLHAQGVSNQLRRLQNEGLIPASTSILSQDTEVSGINNHPAIPRRTTVSDSNKDIADISYIGLSGKSDRRDEENV